MVLRDASTWYNYRLSEINCIMPESGYEVIRKYTAQARNSKTVPFFFRDLDVLHLPEIAPSNGTTHAWHLFAPAFDFDRIGSPENR